MAKSSSKKSVSKTALAPTTVKKAPAASFSQPELATDADVSILDLFVSELKDTYWAENHLVKSIPKLVDAAGDSDLKQALEDHLEVTRTHAARLEEAFELLGEKILAKKCDAMEGLTMSGEHVIENTLPQTPTRDLGIIMSALKVENFEITTYKGLVQVANSLGKTDVANLLQQNMDEEIEASNLLSEMSQSGTGTAPSELAL